MGDLCPGCVYYPPPPPHANADNLGFMSNTKVIYGPLAMQGNRNREPMRDEQYLRLALAVMNSSVPNCDGLHIPLESDLNLEA